MKAEVGMRNRAVTAAILTNPLSIRSSRALSRTPGERATDLPLIYREAMTSAIAAITPSAVRVGA